MPQQYQYIRWFKISVYNPITAAKRYPDKSNNYNKDHTTIICCNAMLEHNRFCQDKQSTIGKYTDQTQS